MKHFVEPVSPWPCICGRSFWKWIQSVSEMPRLWLPHSKPDPMVPLTSPHWILNMIRDVRHHYQNDPNWPRDLPQEWPIPFRTYASQVNFGAIDFLRGRVGRAKNPRQGNTRPPPKKWEFNNQPLDDHAWTLPHAYKLHHLFVASPCHSPCACICI